MWESLKLRRLGRNEDMSTTSVVLQAVILTVIMAVLGVAVHMAS
jgi:hypothetical protein